MPDNRCFARGSVHELWIYFYPHIWVSRIKLGLKLMNYVRLGTNLFRHLSVSLGTNLFRHPKWNVYRHRVILQISIIIVQNFNHSYSTKCFCSLYHFCMGGSMYFPKCGYLHYTTGTSFICLFKKKVPVVYISIFFVNSEYMPSNVCKVFCVYN